MIHTLTSNLALYHINRNRVAMLTAMERRRAGFLVCALFVVLPIAVYSLILALR
jgi:hypothetical protein